MLILAATIFHRYDYLGRKDDMPTYQYQCDACGNPLEVVQSFSDEALTICPNCNEPKLKKVYGSVGVVFKGSGFYKTDSRSSNTSGSSSTPASAPAASSSPAAPSTPAKTSTPATTTSAN